MKWSRGTFEIEINVASLREQKGLVSDCGFFGIFKSHRGWSLTHLPTGYRVLMTGRQRDAKALAELLAPMVQDCGTDVSPDVLTEVIRPTMEDWVRAHR